MGKGLEKDDKWTKLSNGLQAKETKPPETIKKQKKKNTYMTNRDVVKLHSNRSDVVRIYEERLLTL